MQINLEAAEQHSIEAYSDTQIQVNSIIYEKSVIVSREEIISDLTINNIQQLNEQNLEQAIRFNPELIIIGHQNNGVFPPLSIISKLSQMRIGIECMSIGAACRTFNILLNEHRAVVGFFIFS